MAYTSSTASDRLAAVRQAIDDCLTAQEYTQRGKTARRAKLSELRALERDLLAEIQEEANGGKMATLGQIIPRV